jgi:hypothetical protein
MPTPLIHRCAGAVLLACAASTSHATLITFDERPWVFGPDEYAWYSNPIGDLYDSLGVDIEDGYLQPAGQDPTYANSQFLLGGPSFTIRFTGTLPTYVSLSFTSPSPTLQATVSATGPGSFAAMADTGGTSWGGPDVGFVETPYHAHSFASFHSAQGIAQLDFGTFGITRTIGKIDNLYFGNVPAVPEPGALVLGAVGLGLIGAMARRQRRRSS